MDSKFFHYYICMTPSVAALCNVSTLKCGIVVQVGINVQVGIFLQKNKRTGWNKCTGGNIH